MISSMLQYLFDIQGYVVLKNVVSAEVLEACNRAMARIEAMDPAQYPDPLLKYTVRPDENDAGDRPLASPADSELYISNILEGDAAFQPLIDLPEVIDVVRDVTGSSFRLNHTYGIWRWGHGFTRLHHNGTPCLPYAQYRCCNGQIISNLTKAVFPMTDVGPQDGGFAVIPGSHKSNFTRPWSDHPDDNPALVPVLAKAGDCIVFTEALAHGSTVNASGCPRRTVYLCYSAGWMPDWGGAELGLRFSKQLLGRLTESQAQIVCMKDLDAPMDKG